MVTRSKYCSCHDQCASITKTVLRQNVNYLAPTSRCASLQLPWQQALTTQSDFKAYPEAGLHDLADALVAKETTSGREHQGVENL